MRHRLVALLSCTLLGAVSCGASRPAAVSQKVKMAFSALPGDVGFHLLTTTEGKAINFSQRASDELFCASAFKGFVLAEFLRQAEGTPPEVSLADTIAMSDAIRSFGGKEWGELLKTGDTVVYERALEEMIAHSDNTGTDIILRAVGADRVRALVRRLELAPVNIPDSTRRMMVELLGFPLDAPDPGWEALQARLNGPDTSAFSKTPLTARQRMATSPAVLATFYASALKDGFFKTAASQAKFRAILSLPEAGRIINPAGATTYVKGGNLNFLDFNAIAIGGATTKGGRLITFGAIQNWRATDPAEISAGNAAFAQAMTAALKIITEELPE